MRKWRKNFGVSPGTIHVRVEKMRQSGIIEGTKVKINERRLGYDVCCFIGIILKSAKDYEKVIANRKILMKRGRGLLHNRKLFYIYQGDDTYY